VRDVRLREPPAQAAASIAPSMPDEDLKLSGEPPLQDDPADDEQN
jgi:hypothetical protein